MMINTFLEHVKQYPLKNAFIYSHKNRLISKTYKQFYQDILRMSSLLNAKNINSPLLLFFKPSYELYVLMLTCFLKEIPIVFIDEFKNKQRFCHMLSQVTDPIITLTNQTRLIKLLYSPTRPLKTLNITNYQKYDEDTDLKIKNTNATLLITFSSGVSNKPKMIKRTLNDLTGQFDLIKKQIIIGLDQPVLALLPIYVLANLLLGVTSFLSFKTLTKKRAQNLSVLMEHSSTTCLCASVSKLLAFKKPLPFVTKCLTGGSIISYNDAKKLKYLYPNATFSYFYGASEAIMMAHTTLDDYLVSLENDEVLVGDLVDDIDITIKPTPYGEICVKGHSVLKSDEHRTGDIGYLKDQKLFLLGKKKACLLTDPPFFHFPWEIKFMKDYPKISKVCFYPYQGQIYVIVEGSKKLLTSIDLNKYPFNFLFIKKMPLDMRHQYKIDYNQIENLIILKKGR